MLEQIWFPVALLTAIGVAAGLLLALASRFLTIPVGKKVEEARSFLPGINCGACGFPGCDQYAKAVVEEGAAPNRCVPGREATARKLCDLMGVPFEGMAARKKPPQRPQKS